MQGEILIIDSKVYISNGIEIDGRTKLATATDNAAMLVTAQVKTWKEIKISTSMSLAELQRFVLGQASLIGMSSKVPFPFIVRGKFKNIKCML